MMEVNKKLLYIGNNLSKSTKYTTTMDTLSSLLETENYQVIKSSGKKNKIFRLLDMCWSVIKFRNIVDYILIDTFSTSNFYYAFLTSQLARIFKIPYIPILHGGNLPYRLKKSKKMAKMIFTNSYKNVAPSNYLKTTFEKEGYPTLFIPNILEIEKYNFSQREKIKPNILWVRAFKHLYNPRMAIEMLKLLKEDFPDAKLCMVGPEMDVSFSECKKLVETYSLQKSVEFTGVLSKENWHNKSKSYDIFINTTNFDNTPVSIMEAMALGITIVSTNAGGMPYLIEDGIDGVLVKKEDFVQMKNAIVEIVKNQTNTFAQNARKKAESFGWNQVKQKWTAILK